MKVYVRAYATLTSKIAHLLGDKPPGSIRAGSTVGLEIPSGSTVRELLKRLDVDEKEAAVSFVNGMKCSIDHPLSEGDEVGIFPPLGGG
jgi:sulfur carrier protein ThiS